MTGPALNILLVNNIKNIKNGDPGNDSQKLSRRKEEPSTSLQTAVAPALNKRKAKSCSEINQEQHVPTWFV